MIEPAAWWWIPITVWAAFAQTIRNAAQRSLVAELGTLGATLVRFLYGLPFAAIWLFVVLAWNAEKLPAANPKFLLWTLLGAVAQIAATALLLRTMQERNFALGVAYSKSEVLQVAIFAFVILGDPFTLPLAAAVACGTLGVLLLTKEKVQWSWAAGPTLFGLGSGACFALAAVGYRGAALSVDSSASFLVAAAFTLLIAQSMQTLLLGGYLAAKNPATVVNAAKQWRRSLLAGFMGAAASAGWFTAFAIEPAAHVRTLGLVELIFSYVVSLKLFREKLTTRELCGMGLLTAGVLLVTLKN